MDFYVVVDRQSPHHVIGIFSNRKTAVETAKLFRFEMGVSPHRKDLDNSPFIWEVNTSKTYFDRLPREIVF